MNLIFYAVILVETDGLLDLHDELLGVQCGHNIDLISTLLESVSSRVATYLY